CSVSTYSKSERPPSELPHALELPSLHIVRRRVGTCVCVAELVSCITVVMSSRQSPRTTPYGLMGDGIALMALPALNSLCRLLPFGWKESSRSRNSRRGRDSRRFV